MPVKNMEKIDELLKMSIVASKGIGDICLGMSASSFISSYVKNEYYYASKILKIRACFPNLLIYIFFDSINIYIDVVSSKIVKITLYNKFEGKYLDEISLGNTVGQLRRLRSDLSFDDDNVMIGQYELIMVTDEDLTSIDCDVDAAIIEMIVIRKPVLA